MVGEGTCELSLALGPAKVRQPGLWGFGEVDGAPVSASISSPFGPRAPIPTPSGYTNPFHPAIDLPTAGGTPIIHAGDDGVVSAAGPAWNGYGNAVFVRGDSSTCHFIYAHMQEGLHVGVGQVVKRGQVIGQVGTTGASTGDHLHFGVTMAGLPTIRDINQYVDPQLWLDPMRYFTENPDVPMPLQPPLTGVLPKPGTWALCVTTRETTPDEIKLYLDADPGANERALWMLIGGVWRAYIFGAPDPVNAGFPNPIPAGSPVMVVA